MLRGSLQRAGVASAMLLFVIVSPKTSEGQSNDAQGFHEFPQPEVRRSARGFLTTTLEAKITDNVIQDPHTGLHTVRTPTYEGTIPGPTLRVKPGDVLAIRLINNLPANPEQERMGAFPHDRYTTNLHTHGFTVSPRGISDNVFREMAPGTTNFVLVKIPRDHPSGTFWYHPHKHGAVTFQFFGGMAGVLIIEGRRGTLDYVPEVKAAKEVVMAFQVVRTDPKGQVPFVYLGAEEFGTNPFAPEQPAGLWSTLTPGNTYVTTNGVINPTLYMRPGEVQRWRLLAAGSGEIFVVALCNNPPITPQHPQCVVPPGGTTVPRLNIIANDGITIPKMRPLA
ncbi:MAG TPA: multicopper oxidase domain-containing protein, partial [Candidatus Binatia bacterium]|nr:multicopper oxidase domain-containing protein [Candidatus Binatia bacterium]